MRELRNVARARMGSDKVQAFRRSPQSYYFEFRFPGKLHVRPISDIATIPSFWTRGQKCTLCEYARARGRITRYICPSEIHRDLQRASRSVSISDFNLMPSRYLRQDLPIPISCYRTFRDAPPRFLHIARASGGRLALRGHGENRKSLLSLSLFLSLSLHSLCS